jgi:YD repeat-containing protein
MSGGTAIYTADWTYDAASNLTSASDDNSAYAYTYNSDNNVTQVDNNGTPTGPHVVLNIGYDNMQRETSLSATVAGTADLLRPDAVFRPTRSSSGQFLSAGPKQPTWFGGEKTVPVTSAIAERTAQGCGRLRARAHRRQVEDRPAC